MKQSLTCPKCQHRRLWHIAEVAEKDMGQPTRLSVSVAVGWWGKTETGTFELFICERCGYCEWYAKALEALREDPQRGIKLISSQEPHGGPYR